MKKDKLSYTTYIDVKREEDKSFPCKCLSNASRIFNLLKSRQPVKRCYIYFSVSGFYEVFQLSHFRPYGQEYDLQKQCNEVFKKSAKYDAWPNVRFMFTRQRNTTTRLM